MHITTEGAYAIFGDDTYNAVIYGNLYNWFTVHDERGLCMEGYHVPSDEEWTILTDYLGGEEVAGGKMKECTIGSCSESEFWNSPNTGATNESSFTALPAGARSSGSNANYNQLGNFSFFWSASEQGSNWACSREISYYSPEINIDGNSCGTNQHNGFSIRCLAD